MSEKTMISVLQTYDVETGERQVLRRFSEHIEAPNWSRDGKFLLYNSEGHIFRYDIATGKSAQIDTGICTRCNNDHVLSFDGTWLGISSGVDGDGASRVWTVPLSGGQPRQITPEKPSYLHGISPDGKTLAYCAERSGNFDVYVRSADGSGEEVRLTTAEGLDDGPEYDPSGEYIWFNSVRSGLMQAYRMRTDGSEQTQMTADDSNNWFPHVSPDGRRVVFVSYYKGDVAPGDHPANKNIRIRLMDACGGPITTLIATDPDKGELGGQGTMNVNSWAPDSRRFAFVTYVFED